MAISPQVLQSIANPAQGLASIGTAFLQGQKIKQDKKARESANQAAQLKAIAEVKKQDIAASKLQADQLKAGYENKISQLDIMSSKADFAGKVAIGLSEITDPKERFFEQKRIAESEMGKAFGFNYTDSPLNDTQLGMLKQQSDEAIEYAKLNKEGKNGIVKESGIIIDKDGNEIGSGFRSTLGVSYVDATETDKGYIRIPKGAKLVPLKAGGTVQDFKDPYAKGDAKAQEVMRKNINDQSFAAEKAMPTLNILNSIIDDPRWEQGSFAEIGAELGNIAGRLGIDIPQKWNPTEAYIVMGAAAQEVINNMGQIKGNLNKEEVKIAKDASMGISNPKHAARAKVKAAIELAIRDQERQIQMERYPSKDLSGFKAKWLEWKDNKKIVKRVVSSNGEINNYYYSESKKNAIKWAERYSVMNGETGQKALDTMSKALNNFHKTWNK